MKTNYHYWTNLLVTLLFMVHISHAYEETHTDDQSSLDQKEKVDPSLSGSIFQAASTIEGKDCVQNGVQYEEGVGFTDVDIPCKMYVCDYGKISTFYSGCFMDGKCYDEGQTWVSNCEQFTCVLTGGGYRPKSNGKMCSVNSQCYSEGESWTSDCVKYKCTRNEQGFVPTVVDKRCKIEWRGKRKCLKDGERARSAPCVKRKCEIFRDNGDITTHLVLEQGFGGCGYAKGCRALNEIWTYRCVTKQCVTDGNDFIKISLIPRCIHKGQCFVDGQSYTTKSCVERTCKVNHFIQQAWFEETNKGCKYNDKCLNEGETVTKNCSELTCMRDDSSDGRIKYVMKETGNVCGKGTYAPTE